MSTLNPFLTPLVEQIVPGALRLKDKLSHASVGMGRYNSLFTPITGQSGYSAGASGTKLMTFKITGADYADLSTLVLSFSAQSDVAATDYAIDESVLSVISQLTVRVGGVQLYTITDFPTVYNALVALSMPKAVYNQDGPVQGLYKSSDILGGNDVAAVRPLNAPILVPTAGAGTVGSYDTIQQRSNRYVASTWLSGGGAGGQGGRFYSIPLGFLFSGFSTYFPLRNVSNIEIEFLLQSSIGAVIVPAGVAGVPGATPPTQIIINETEMRLDMVRCSPDLYALMDSEIAHGSGVTMTMDLHTNIPFSLNNTADTPSERALQTAQSVRFLKSVFLTTRLTGRLNNPNWSKSTFGNHQFAQFRLLVNGMSYPQIPITKCWDAFNEAKKTMNALGNLTGDSPMSYQTWLGGWNMLYGTGGAAVAGATVAPSRDGTWWGSGPADDARFVLATNLETFLTSRECDLDGINLAESAGSLVEVRVSNAPCSVAWTGTAAAPVVTPTPESVTYNVILHHSGILSIKGGAVEFLK
jgi:hypothetical protein